MFDIHAPTCSRVAPDTVSTATRMGLLHCRDRGATWDDLHIQRFSPCVCGRDIKVSPRDPTLPCSCVGVARHGNTGANFRSTDAGQTRARPGPVSTI